MRRSRRVLFGILALIVAAVVFVIPFAFIVLTATKNAKESAFLDFAWPTEFRLFQNIADVFAKHDYILIRAFINSTILTVASVALMVVLASLVAFVIQRRRSTLTSFVSFMVLVGLILPPAVVPTIWVLQGTGLFKTLFGLILIETVFGLSFAVMLFRSFLGSIPRELDEAAIVDGAGSLRLFFTVIFPLMRPMVITVIIIQSVAVFNNFTYPLYFLPGDAGATVQLTLFNFKSDYETSWNLLFTDILLITIPPLIAYIFFSRQIVSGMTAGAVKG